MADPRLIAVGVATAAVVLSNREKEGAKARAQPTARVGEGASRVGASQPLETLETGLNGVNFQPLSGLDVVKKGTGGFGGASGGVLFNPKTSQSPVQRKELLVVKSEADFKKYAKVFASAIIAEYQGKNDAVSEAAQRKLLGIRYASGQVKTNHVNAIARRMEMIGDIEVHNTPHVGGAAQLEQNTYKYPNRSFVELQRILSQVSPIDFIFEMATLLALDAICKSIRLRDAGFLSALLQAAMETGSAAATGYAKGGEKGAVSAASAAAGKAAESIFASLKGTFLGHDDAENKVYASLAAAVLRLEQRFELGLPLRDLGYACEMKVAAQGIPRPFDLWANRMIQPVVGAFGLTLGGGFYAYSGIIGGRYVVDLETGNPLYSAHFIDSSAWIKWAKNGGS